jgi:hypothetical protein
MKVMNDGFIYKLVDGDKAKDIFALNLFELYIIWDDDSETLIDECTQLNEALDNGYEIGIPVGSTNLKQTRC